jgi:hypothetical protein
MKDFRIDPEFQNKIPPIGEDEFKQLRENILAAGEVYEPLVVWKEENILVDGHNRWKVIQEKPQITQIRYSVREMSFPDKWAAFDWMYKNQLGRRNLTDEQRTYLMGKRYEARKKSVGGQTGNVNAKNDVDKMPESFIEPKDVKAGTAGVIGKDYGVDGKTVRRAEKFAHGVDVLRDVSPAAADKVLAGKAKVSKNAVAEIARLERDEVEAAADAIMSDMVVKPQEPQKRKPSGYTKADRELHDMIQAAIAPLRDTENAPEYTVDSLIEDIEINGATYVKSVRNMLDTRKELYHKDADAKIRVFRAIASIIQDLTKVRGEYTA